MSKYNKHMYFYLQGAVRLTFLLNNLYAYCYSTQDQSNDVHNLALFRALQNICTDMIEFTLMR